jgi:hypothetical protein
VRREALYSFHNPVSMSKRKAQVAEGRLTGWPHEGASSPLVHSLISAYLRLPTRLEHYLEDRDGIPHKLWAQGIGEALLAHLVVVRGHRVRS